MKPSLNYQLAIIFLSIVGAGIILMGTSRYGAGLSSDSVFYITGSRAIADNPGVLFVNGPIKNVWPPLYPALLAMIDWAFGIDALVSAPIVNAGLFGLIIYLSGILFFRHVASVGLAFLATVSVVFTVPLVIVALMALSETLFICFVLLSIIFAESYLAKQEMSWVLLLSLAVALACITRYIGVALILAMISVILLARHTNLQSKIRHLVLFGAISALPLALWAIRNYLLTATLFGARLPSTFTLSENIRFTFTVFQSWYIPQRLSDGYFILIVVGAVAAYPVFLGLKLSRAKNRSELFVLLPALLFTVAYVALLITTSTTAAYDQINDRLLAPIYVPATLLLFVLLEFALKPLTNYVAPSLLRAVVIGSVVLWLIYPISTTMKLSIRAMEYGLGYGRKVRR